MPPNQYFAVRVLGKGVLQETFTKWSDLWCFDLDGPLMVISQAGSEKLVVIQFFFNEGVELSLNEVELVILRKENNCPF